MSPDVNLRRITYVDDDPYIREISKISLDEIGVF
jgi:hypothetical protein